MFKSTSQLIAIILGVGMVGQNFFVLNMLSKRESDMPNLAQLKTTDNSSSQMTYKRDGEKLDVLVTHNMHSPKTVMFTSEKSKWNGKIDYNHKEYIAHHPVDNARLTAEYLQCIKEKGSAEGQGEIVGQSLITSTPASSWLSSVPIVGWVANSLAVKKAGQAGKKIAGDFVDC